MSVNPLRVVFMGSPEFAVPCFEAVAEAHAVVCVVSQPDRPAGRGRKLRPPPVKEAAAARGVEVLQPTRVKTAAFRDTLAAQRADVFVVAAYGRILTPAVLDLPALGCWNVHASLLPAWRGAAPIQWSIIAGDRETGISIMKMDAGLDTGDVALQRTEPIREEDTTATLSARLSRLGAEAIRDALGRLHEGGLPTTPQRHEAATYAPLLTKADGHLDFRAEARAVSCRARGVDPWPGAWARLGDSPGAARIKLYAPRVVTPPPGGADPDAADPAAADRAAADRGAVDPDDAHHDAVDPVRADRAAPAPGRILGLDGHGLVVACGEGAVSFGELQLPGRKRLSADAVMAGRGLQIGAVLT